MRNDDLTPDEELARVLRAFDRDAIAQDGDVDRLAARIVASATTHLDRRRHPPAPWWEYAATWARPVFEMVLVTAVLAIICITWVSRGNASDVALRDSRVNVDSQTSLETLSLTPQQLLYSLVAPVEQQVLAAQARGRQ